MESPEPGGSTQPSHDPSGDAGRVRHLISSLEALLRRLGGLSIVGVDQCVDSPAIELWSDSDFIYAEAALAGPADPARDDGPFARDLDLFIGRGRVALRVER